MSGHWGPSSGGSHDLNLLDDILIDIDDKTLQALTGANPLPPLPDEDSAGRSGSAKRRRSAQQFPNWLATEFANDDEPEEAETDEGGADAKVKIGRKGKPMSSAAVQKAEREKQRRERLNEYFDELARMCDPSGKTSKSSNRINVVSDAIRVVQQLRVENNQLKQLNKFLEERVGMLERAKAQAVYQQAVAQQSMMGTMQPMHMQPQGMMATMTMDPQQQQQQQQMDPLQAQYTMVGMATTMPMATVPMYPVKELHADVTMPLPANAPTTGWLPAPDVNKDEKLRPPAA